MISSLLPVREEVAYAQQTHLKLNDGFYPMTPLTNSNFSDSI